MTDNGRPVGTLEQAVVDAEQAHGNIPEEHGAVVALARAYARNMDEASEIDTETETKALYLGPHLLKVLTLLDLAPATGSGSTKSRPSRGEPKGEPFKKARKTVMDLMRENAGA